MLCVDARDPNDRSTLTGEIAIVSDDAVSFGNIVGTSRSCGTGVEPRKLPRPVDPAATEPAGHNGCAGCPIGSVA